MHYIKKSCATFWISIKAQSLRREGEGNVEVKRSREEVKVGRKVKGEDGEEESSKEKEKSG